MSIEKTLSIIKPDATARNITGQVNSIIEKSGLKIIAQKRIKLTKDVASKFYEVHKDRPFYQDIRRKQKYPVRIVKVNILKMSMKKMVKLLDTKRR